MIERWFESFSLLEKTHAADCLGGAKVSYTASVGFQGVVTLGCGQSINLAEQPAIAEDFVLLHEYDVTLAPGNHVRRERDGAIFRVGGQSDNMRAPAFSGLRFAQVPVERVVLPC